MNQPLVSVVTPFHNTREFLAECIESVLRQTYQNWEYILIDNASTDGGGELAEAYVSSSSKRIRVIRTPKLLSQVQNYNFALTCILPESKYCKMVQADDWIYPECIERMVGVAESDPSIGIVSSYRLKGSRVQGEGLSHSKSQFSGETICRKHLTTSLFAFGTPTTLLYRSEIIRQHLPFFDESARYEDTDACYRTLRSWNFGFVHQILSFTRVDNESIMTGIRRFHPYYLDRYLQLGKFGSLYLERDELTRELRAWENQYYRFLALRLLSGSKKGFWQYQISGLKSGGLRLNWLMLFKHIFLHILHLVTNPGMACAKLYTRLRWCFRKVPISSE